MEEEDENGNTYIKCVCKNLNVTTVLDVNFIIFYKRLYFF